MKDKVAIHYCLAPDFTPFPGTLTYMYLAMLLRAENPIPNNILTGRSRMSVSDRREWRGVLYGLCYGVVVAAFVSPLVSVMIAGFAGDSLRGMLLSPFAFLLDPRLYPEIPMIFRHAPEAFQLTVVPIAMVYAWAGWLFVRQSRLAQRIWLLGCIVGFLAPLFVLFFWFALGLIFFIRTDYPYWEDLKHFWRDLKYFLVSWKIVWGPVIALVSLPITAPVATGTLLVLRKILKQ